MTKIEQIKETIKTGSLEDFAIFFEGDNIYEDESGNRVHIQYFLQYCKLYERRDIALFILILTNSDLLCVYKNIPESIIYASPKTVGKYRFIYTDIEMMEYIYDIQQKNYKMQMI